MTRQIWNRACLNITGQVRFDPDSFCEKKIQQSGILHCTHAVTNSLRAEQSDRIPNALWTRAFAGVNGHMPTGIAAAPKMFGKKLRRKICFVAGEIERDDVLALSQERVEFDMRRLRSISATQNSN